MSKVVLPYTLREGQIAYASKVMANLNAITTKVNNVAVPGIPDGDVEQALCELKYLIDAEAKAKDKVIVSFTYDAANNMLKLLLKDGAFFELSMAPFINDYSGAASASINTFIDGEHKISSTIKEGAITHQMLSSVLQQLIDGKITAAAPGNAEQICFADGSTMQEKLDNGEFNGRDGVAVAIDGLYYFRVGDDGHLYLGIADGAEPPPLSIDQRGHLIYTID